jgi:PAS domain S-box-containing protein
MENRLAKSEARSPFVTYGIAIVAALGGLLIRLPLTGVLSERVPYITFFLATSVSAYFGGFGPGLVTTLLGALLAAFYVIPPEASILFDDTHDFLGLAMFLGVSSFISYTCGRLHRTTRVEHALRQIFQQTLVSIGDAVISTDIEKRIRFMNRVAEELTGWPERDAKDKPIQEIFRIVQEGSEVPAEIPVDKVLATGRIVGLGNHTELIAKDGRRIPIDDSASPIKNHRGEVVGAVLVFRDITERRRIELARKREQAELNRLHEDLKQFTFAATHDLREPLRMITAYAQMLERRFAKALGDEGALFISHVVDGAARITRLVDGLLQFSRTADAEESKPRLVDSAAALQDALDSLRLVMQETQARISWDGLPRVFADDIHVAQLFQNLIENALKYTKPGVRPVIRISAVQEGDHCKFAVEDNGIGIPPRFQEQVFEPFKRLHGTHIKGAGIGLATCRRIVELHGGRIWVESDGNGNGSTFYFTLPAETGGNATHA